MLLDMLLFDHSEHPWTVIGKPIFMTDQTFDQYRLMCKLFLKNTTFMQYKYNI